MNEKKVLIITIVCLAFILLAGGTAIWYFQFNVLEEKKADLARVTGELEAAKTRVREIEPLKKEIKKLEEDEKEKIKKIPNLTRAEYDVFADMLDEFRRRSGVTVSRGGWVQASKPSPVVGRPPVKPQPAMVHKVQYDLAVTGSFFQLLRYINLIEQETRFINVENFSIGKSSETASTGATGAPALKRDLKLTLFSYTYRPKAEALEIELEEQRKGRSTDIPD
ncbi:MAG TPA: hypothetical protein VJB14_08685 [Planctomycetota bacterium]|nr:hypothetical protein [Planctomycetota bacterium]